MTPQHKRFLLELVIFTVVLNAGFAAYAYGREALGISYIVMANLLAYRWLDRSLAGSIANRGERDDGSNREPRDPPPPARILSRHGD